MRRPLLTAAMIARDEERHLPACLASLADVVDEVVLVDTGSVDRTVEIARAHGATVLHHSWSDDFSAPRNLGLDNARGRWILYIDADERLRPVARSGALVGERGRRRRVRRSHRSEARARRERCRAPRPGATPLAGQLDAALAGGGGPPRGGQARARGRLLSPPPRRRCEPAAAGRLRR